MSVALLTAALLLGAAQGIADPPVLVVEGVDVPRSEYECWLVRSVGELHANGFADERRVQDAATAAGVTPSQEEVTARVAEQIEARIRGAFQGDREAWREELELGGGEVAHRALLTRVAEHELALEGLVRARRAIGEEALRAEWEHVHGRDGRVLTLRRIALDVPYPDREPGVTRSEVNERRARVEAETLERARALRARVLAGESFGDLAREHSDDAETRAAGGLLAPGVDADALPTAVLDALYALEPGQVAPPAIVRGRALLHQLVEEHRVPFESVRGELERALLASPVTTAEIETVADGLAAARPLRVRPAVYAEDCEPDVAVLDLGEREISRGEYAAWLRRRFGRSYVPRFVRERCMEREARELGLTVDDEALARRVRELLQVEIDAMFKGDEAAWAAQLAERGDSAEARARRARPRARVDLLAEAALLRTRTFDEVELRAAWEERYGPGGRTRRARLIALPVVVPPVPPDADAETVGRLRREAREAVRAELAELRRRIENGEDFATLARKHSRDEPTRENGGLIDGPFRARRLPAACVRAVEALRVGGLTEPLLEQDVGWLLELVSDVTVPFEDVRAELEAELRASRPPAIEVAVHLNGLYEASGLRVLPALYE